ncbi:hypothetical protein GECvBGOT_gp026 [Salmonella phage GEC_vB_GOT]|nr:hypothetical protein GECvBGOT_gp026 [Salmonella phage GEC_vB_GOT]
MIDAFVIGISIRSLGRMKRARQYGHSMPLRLLAGFVP